MVWSDNTPVAPFYVYDSNGNIIVQITDQGFRVQNPNDPQNYTEIFPNTVDDGGVPWIAGYYFELLRYLIRTVGSNGADIELQTGSGTGEYHTKLANRTTSAKLQLGESPTVQPSTADYLEVGHASSKKTYLQAYDTAVESTLRLNPDGGAVQYNGIPITREVGATKNETSTADITTETVTDSVTFAAVNGRTYEVEWTGNIDPGGTTPANGDRYIGQLREDSISGTVRDTQRHIWAGGGIIQVNQRMRGRWTAGSTGNKTFVVTWQRDTGVGNINRFAAASRPSILTVKEVA